MSQRRVVGIVVAALLAACSTPPPKPEPGAALPPQAPADVSPLDDLRQRWQARAALAESVGDLAAAALALEVLVLIDAQAFSARQAEMQSRIDRLQAERNQRAAAELKAGRLDAAEQMYLRSLALRPHNGEAAQALREIDRARNRRDHLGQSSRITLTRRATVPATTSAAAAARIEASMLLEHATMLAAQGEFDEAIVMLEGQLVRDPAGGTTRALLADLHYRKALALQEQDPAAARAALTRALRLLPNHPQAQGLSRQLAPARP